MNPSRSEETRARYRAAAASRTGTAQRPAGTTAVPASEATTRMTLDLSPAQRRALARWTAQAGLEIDRPRLASAEVLRALIEVLEPTGDDEGEQMSERAREILRTVLLEHLRGQ